MFHLVSMKDTIRIPPWLFHMKLEDAVIEILNKKFANKVVHKVGLCITLWDITKIEDSFIFPGDGSSHTVVHFRLVVFRPYSDEILSGKIKSSSKEGVYVTMGFFDDILIPADALQHPSRFDEAEQLFIWEYLTDEGKHDLFMEIGEELRFRVADEIFVDTTPNAPEVAPGDATEGEAAEIKKSPYTIIGSAHEPGLGLLSWWSNT